MKEETIDKKILYRLHQNARSPISEIAKDTGLTREIVTYRMHKLEEKGIIKSSIAKINQALFCEGIGTVIFKLVRSDETRFKEIIKFLRNHHAINFMAELSGSADVVVTILYKNSEDLANSISEMAKFMGNALKEHHVSLYITEYKFDRSGIIFGKPEEETSKPIISFGEKKEVILDKNDIIILKELAKNCRIRNTELAKKTSLSEDMIRLRIKKLEQQKVIFGYTITMDSNKLGFGAYYMELQLEHMTKETISKLSYYVHSNPYIVYCARAVGKYNVIMTVYAKNNIHFNDILLDIRKQFGTLLTDYEFQHEIEEMKEIYVLESFIEASE